MTNSQVQKPGNMKLDLNQAMALAIQHQSKGNIRQAETLIKQILKANPKHAPAIHLLGVLANQAGKPELALKLIGEAIQINKNVGLFYSNYGEISRTIGDLENAIEYGKKATELSPNTATAFSNLGVAYYDNKEFDLAEACQKKAISINPKLATALNNLGSIYRERKDKEAAISFYKQAIEHNPNYSESLSNLGACLTEKEEFEESLKYLSQAIKINPKHPEAHCNIGSAFMGLEIYDKARIAFNNAIKHKPDYVEAFLGLAKISQHEKNLSEAERYARQALAIDANHVDAHTVLAGILIEEGFSEKAEQLLKNALALEPDSFSALNAWGTLLTEQGLLEEAEEVFKKSAKIDEKNSIISHIAFTQVRKTKGDDEHFLALKKEAENIDKMRPRKAMALNFSLGKCYDDLKDYDKAFNHFAAACESKRKTFQYDQNISLQKINEIKQIFNNDFIERNSGTGYDSNVPIFVLGMPRSGTTLTEQIIASHPDVYGAGELPDLGVLTRKKKAGDMRDFPQNFLSFAGNDFSLLGEQYVKGLKARSPEAKHITDKMPANYQYLGLIHTILPNAKIVHVNRNPVDTCLSCFTKNFNTGQFFSYDLRELGKHYKSYVEIMNHWREVLPESAFYEVNYESLISDNENETRKLIDYCGLEWNDACLESHKNSRNIRTASVSQVRQPIYNSSVERWRPYEKHLGPLLEELGDLVKK